MMYNITAFKNVFQYRTAKFNSKNHNYFCINLILHLVGPAGQQGCRMLYADEPHGDRH